MSTIRRSIVATNNQTVKIMAGGKVYKELEVVDVYMNDEDKAWVISGDSFINVAVNYQEQNVRYKTKSGRLIEIATGGAGFIAREGILKTHNSAGYEYIEGNVFGNWMFNNSYVEHYYDTNLIQPALQVDAYSGTEVKYSRDDGTTVSFYAVQRCLQCVNDDSSTPLKDIYFEFIIDDELIRIHFFITHE